MLVVVIALSLLFLKSLYVGDVFGAATFALIIAILSWVLWGERGKGEKGE